MMTTNAELTTALTNLVNAILTLIPICWTIRLKGQDVRRQVWLVAYLSFFFVCVFGFAIHGFVMSRETNILLWRGMDFCLCYMIGFYVVAISYETGGESRIRKTAGIYAVLAFVFALLTIYCDENTSLGFTAFILYCAGNLIYVIWKLFRHREGKPYFIWFFIGIIFLVIGSILQTVKSIQFTLIVEFNYNCVYHIFTMIFVLFQFRGMRLAAEMEKSVQA